MKKNLLELYETGQVDEEEIKNEKVENKTLTEEELIEERKRVLKMIEEETLLEIEEFNEVAWKKGSGYQAEKFSDICEKLEGLDTGLYLLAAESNVGKSALLLEMLDEFSKNKDNKLFGVYFSLDDSVQEIMPRLIAKNKTIPIGVAAKPGRYQEMIDNGEPNSINYESYLRRREEGIQELKERVGSFKIYDSNTIRSVEDIEEKIEELNILIKSVDPEASLIVAIDSINDLRFKTKTFNSDRAKHDEAAKLVKDWTVRYNIPILASTHLMKDSSGKNLRPTLGRIKESVEYVYEASLIWLLYNDVGLNDQSAKVYYEQDGTVEKFPIIEMDWAKNKKSSFKGRTFLYFSPEYSKVNEVDQDTSKRLNALVYEG